MKNKEKIQILEHRLNIHSELLERIISKLEFDNEPQHAAIDWKNSIIKCETNELTGSELCKAMLARGDKYIMCRVNDDNNIQVISGWTFYGFSSTTNKYCLYKTPIPINNHGEPLTASDVDL